jgi:hypothetical protein
MLVLVLDPNVKDLYFRSRGSDDQYLAGMEQLGKVYYVLMHDDTQMFSLINTTLPGHQHPRPHHCLCMGSVIRKVGYIPCPRNVFTDAPSFSSCKH